ncbi:response regulator transcription factor [Citricoccus zhacaiensis]
MPESALELKERAHRVLERVARTSHRPFRPDDVQDRIPALDVALAQAEHVLRGLADRGDWRFGAGAPRRMLEVFSLLADVGDVRNRLLMHQLAERHEVLHRMNAALGRLRSVTAVDDFVELMPVEVVNLGYVRSLYSSAEGMQWVAQSAHSTQGPGESRLLLEAGRQDPLRDLHGLFEAEMVQERHPILRHGIRKSRRVHPEIIKVTESDSYVASPLVLRGQVRAFISVDVNAVTGTVDEFDLDLMELFTTGAAIALERLGTSEGRAVAVETREAPGWARSRTRGAEPSPEDLTPREQEILRLVAHGLSNAGIAQRLVISEGTAKTHVKNILRKLGASNRTEAASFLR